MKGRLISFLVICTYFFATGLTRIAAQTTMGPGDMAVLGFNTTNDAVSWVTLVDLCPCTEFYFSDNPYQNGVGYCTSQEEFCVKFHVTTLIPAGSIITYMDATYPTAGTVAISPNNGALTCAYSDILTAGTNNGFNSLGDNVLFFQGSYAAPSFICGFKNSGAWNAQGTVVCGNRNHCELPNNLANGVNALYANQCQGAKYNCTLTTGTATALAAAINDYSTWTCDLSNPVTPPQACTFSVAAPKPCFSCQINDTICPGQSTTLLAQGSGSNIKWYNSLTGGSLLYTGNSFSTPALVSTTTYYVTQTSGGVESAPRVPITVTTLPQPNAGPDKSVTCVTLPGGSVSMSAVGAGTWVAITGNPGTASIANSTSPTSSISNFSVAGTYRFKWTNGSGCTDTSAIVVTEAANASIATPAQLTCSASSINLTASSTISGATYNWGGGNTSSSFTVTSAGPYTVTVTNPAGGCSATASTIVSSSGSSVSIIATTTPATCGTSSGSATVTVSTGTGPYTYSWSNSGTTQTINNLAGGNYNVTVLGQGGCSATASANVTATGGLSVTPSSSGTTCGNNNGTAGITVTGTGPFTYSWSNGTTVANLINLASGPYYVTVTGSGSCSATATSLVDTSSAITLTVYAGRAGCTSSGTTTVNVNTGAGPYTYLWSNNGTTSSINSLSAGNYSVTVTGAAGCSASATGTVISTGTGVTLTTSSTPSACSSSTGSIIVTTVTGDSPFTYLWSNGATTQTVNNIGGGNYTVTVTANGGCSATAAAVVSASGTLSLTTASNGTTCGNSNGTANVNAGNGSYTYLWNNGVTTDSISNLASGTYTVTVNGNDGCSATTSVVVSQSAGTIAILAQPNAICQGDTSQICAPSGYHIYNWNTGKSTTCIAVTQAGDYYVTVTDNNGCTATSNHLHVVAHQLIPAVITQTGDTLHAQGPFHFQWYLNNAILHGDTSPTLIAIQAGNYYVIQTDTNGCVETSNVQNIKGVTGSVQLTTDKDVAVYPNPTSNGAWRLDVSETWIGGWCDIYDESGRMIYHAQIRSLKSEISLNVARGLYLMRINSLEDTATLKLVKF